MKKGITLIVLLLVLAALVVGYVVYGNYVANQPTDEEETETDTTIEILTLDENSIVSIEYTYENELVCLVKSEDEWQWADDADFPLDQTFPEEMVSALAKLTAKREIADTLDNESDFGLDMPMMVINFKTEGGQEYAYTIGNFNSVAEGYYAKISNKSKIYLTSSHEGMEFEYFLLDMAEAGTLPNITAESIVDVEVKGEDANRTVTTDSAGAEFYSEPYAYFTLDSNGKKIAVDGVAGAEFIGSVADLVVGSAIDFKPDTEKLSAYGLSEDKRIKLDVIYQKEVKSDTDDSSLSVMTNESYSVYIGKTTDGDGNKYYATFEDSYLIYDVEGGDKLFEKLSADFNSYLVCPLTTEEAVSFKLEVAESGAVYFYNTADIEEKTDVLGFLDKLAALTYEKIGNGEKGELVFKATFDLGDEEYLLNVYKYDETHYIASFDVFENLLIPVSQIDSLIADLGNL